MKQIRKQKILGFTLIEMLVVMAVTTMIAMVSIANFREGEKRKRVALAADGIVSVLNVAQAYAQSGKSTTNSDSACRVAENFYVTFSYTNTYSLYAENNCDGIDLIQTFKIPDNTRIRTSGLIVDSLAATSNMRVSFTPPFSHVMTSRNLNAFQTFTTATITLESSDGTIFKVVTINGVSGRIDQ